MPQTPLTNRYAFLALEGNPSVIDMNADYSVTPGRFVLEAVGGRLWLERMMFFLTDAGNFAVDDYGTLPALTNGVELFVEDSEGTQILDLLSGSPIMTNGGWSSRCYDVRYDSFGTGDNALSARWTFSRSGVPLQLDEGSKLVMRVSDNLSGLTRHRVNIQGYHSASRK